MGSAGQRAGGGIAGADGVLEGSAASPEAMADAAVDKASTTLIEAGETLCGASREVSPRTAIAPAIAATATIPATNPSTRARDLRPASYLNSRNHTANPRVSSPSIPKY